MKKLALLAISIAVALILSACTTTPDQEAAAQKTYDAICKNEPPLYLAFVNVAIAKKASERTLARADAIHKEIVSLCETRPTNVIDGLVSLSSAYARFIALNATLD